jgi:DNA-binding transcriptional ArsR family regulator
MSEMQLRYIKALADESRLKIVGFLRDGEKCVCEIYPYLNTTQSNASQHLRILRDANILRMRREGKMIFYSVADKEIFSVLEKLSGIASRSLDSLKKR